MLDLAGPAVRRPEVDFRDIEDPSAFVHGTINKWCRPTSERGPIILSLDEREELHAEGMAILCKLARDFRPHMDGYDQEGWFSGYAAMFLPRKLGDAWHRMHADHLLVTDPETGKRRWRYLEKAVSLDALTGEDPDRQPLLASRSDETDLRSQVGRALDERWQRRRNVILDVADILGQGGTGPDAAATLGLTTAQVQEAVNEIMMVADRLRSDDE
jgi:hypothetical protein